MDLTTSWKVNSLQVKADYNGLQNVVFSANYSVIVQSSATTNPQRGEAQYNIVFSPPGSSQFILYSDLTEADVIVWIQAQLGPEEVTAAENNLAYQVIYNTQPDDWSYPALPWSV